MDDASARLRRPAALLLGIAVLLAVPLVLAYVQAWRSGWYPVGDNAYLSLRSRDVLTADHPLLGTWTSASLSAGRELHNPGPLLFDLLAPPTKVDARLGAAAGAVLLHLGAAVGAVVGAYRLGGARVALLVAAMAAALTWSMGSGLLVDPWQPHVLLLPALALLVAAWSLLHGRSGAWPWAVGLGSLLVQSHVSYVYLVGLVVVVTGVAGWRRSPFARRAHHLVIAAAVGFLAWAQPFVDQVNGKGNLTALASAARGEGPSTGWSAGARLTAAVAAGSDGWWTRSFDRTFAPAPGTTPAPGRLGDLQNVPALTPALVGLGVLALALVATALLARRRADRLAVDGVVVAAVALAGSLVTASTMPLGAYGLGPHQLRLLWPVAVFALGVVALAGLGQRSWWVPASAVVLAALVVATLPERPARTGPSSVPVAIEVMERLAPELDALDPSATYFIDASQLRLFEPYTTPLMLELQRRGIDFTVSEPITLSQVGDHREEDGRADASLLVVEGPDALDPPAGTTVVASATVDSPTTGEPGTVAVWQSPPPGDA